MIMFPEQYFLCYFIHTLFYKIKAVIIIVADFAVPNNSIDVDWYYTFCFTFGCSAQFLFGFLENPDCFLPIIFCLNSMIQLQFPV